MTSPTASPPLPNREPAGKPHARIPAAPSAPSAVTQQPPAAAIEFQQIRVKAVQLIRLFWPQGRKRIIEMRDHRLIYRVALLRLTPEHSQWIEQVVRETAESKPDNPLAKLQKLMRSYAPPGVDPNRLLPAIDVPYLALKDPRWWPSSDQEPDPGANGADSAPVPEPAAPPDLPVKPTAEERGEGRSVVQAACKAILRAKQPADVVADRRAAQPPGPADRPGGTLKPEP